MAITVWVKVVGFSDAERHTLNTLFRVSRTDGPKYVLWTPLDGTSPNVALIDVDSYEAGLDLVSPGFNPHLKIIAVGESAPTGAWRSLQRPVDWVGLVQSLDALFASSQEVDIDIFTDNSAAPSPPPPGILCALLVGIPPVETYYLRARLALAGVLVADEAQTLDACEQRLQSRHYGLALVFVDAQKPEPWEFAKHVVGLAARPPKLMAVMASPDWRAIRQAETMGYSDVLELPFNPQQVFSAFQKV